MTKKLNPILRARMERLIPVVVLVACGSSSRQQGTLASGDVDKTPAVEARPHTLQSTHGLYSCERPAGWTLVPDPEHTTFDLRAPHAIVEFTISGDFNVSRTGSELTAMIQKLFPDTKLVGPWREEAHAGYRSLAGSARAQGADWDWLFLFAADRVVQASVMYRGPTVTPAAFGPVVDAAHLSIDLTFHLPALDLKKV